MDCAGVAEPGQRQNKGLDQRRRTRFKISGRNSRSAGVEEYDRASLRGFKSHPPHHNNYIAVVKINVGLSERIQTI